jgi:hypothetical protein
MSNKYLYTYNKQRKFSEYYFYEKNQKLKLQKKEDNNLDDFFLVLTFF